MTERLGYMERLLKHYAGDISLDCESLRGLAEAVDKDHALPPRQGPRSASPEEGSDYLGAEDENFTVQPVGNSTTREHQAVYLSLGILRLTVSRLLWRVLALELFDAHKGLD